MQVVDLFQLASAILIELAVARQDMQCFKQLGGLFRTDVGFSHRDAGIDQGGVTEA